MDETEHLTKHQRILLRKERREQEKEEAILKRKRKKRNKMIVKVSILIIILVGIGYFFIQSKTPAYTQDPRGPPLMKIMPTSYNFGDVSVAKGTVSTTMNIINEGKGNLVIRNMKSSCMCTTATIIKDGVESPVFGMHSGPASWSQIIGPDETAQLKIYYDPTAHRELRGPVTRVITIYSNDPVNSQTKVRINVNQVA
ncbi:MAG: DUF1573 domain-containing protein [Nanoarchaeota archaeon]|nr:DUF1573 domain-containing protein [Nanoarchaeota archaeon]